VGRILQVTKKHLKFLVLLLVLGGIATLWQLTPLGEYLKPQAMVAIFRENFGKSAAFSPYIAVLVFSFAGFFLIPVNALILATALLFGFWEGIAISFSGVLISCTLGYFLGQALGADTLKKILGKKFEQAVNNIGAESLMAVVSLRILPIGPFGVINLVFGNLRIRYLYYVTGTLIGMLPGILLINYFGRAVTRIMKDPSIMSFVIGIGALILISAILLTVKRYQKKLKHQDENQHTLYPSNNTSI